MKTPDEIKKGLECCYDYYESRCRSESTLDTLTYIRQLEDHFRDLTKKVEQLERERDEARNDLDTLNCANTELHSAYEAMKRERDAAVEDMRLATLVGCHVCKHYYQLDPEVRKYACRVHGSFEEHDFISDDGSVFCGAFKWRGVQEVEK